MKAVIGEYGKVIILTILLGGMVLFLFGKGESGFLGILSQARPVEKVGHEDAFDLAEAIASKAAPTLSVGPKKLVLGTRYDLLDQEYFDIKTENGKGEKAKLSVIKVMAPDGQDLTEVTKAEQFVPELKGEYRITYKASGAYLGSVKTREKTYRFIVD